MAIDVAPATLLDAEELAADMREADAIEVAAVGGHTPYEAVSISIEASKGKAWAARHKGRLVAVYGIVDVSLVNGLAQPWALTTNYVDRVPKEYVKASKKILKLFKARYALLMTTIDARYLKAIRWACALGFEVASTQRIGPSGNDFCLVVMKGDR